MSNKKYTKFELQTLVYIFFTLELFQEDYEIKVSQIIKLWVTHEGFIKSNKDQNFEEVAENYVK